MNNIKKIINDIYFELMFGEKYSISVLAKKAVAAYRIYIAVIFGFMLLGILATLFSNLV